MAPMVMECVVDGCKFATQELEPAIAVRLIELHDKNSHTQVTGWSTNGNSRNKVKFQKPGIDQTQLLEASLDTGHQEGCWDWQWCLHQGEVCRYDSEGEYDTDTEGEYDTDDDTDVVEKSSGEEVAKGRVSFECGNCHY